MRMTAAPKSIISLELIPASLILFDNPFLNEYYNGYIGSMCFSLDEKLCKQCPSGQLLSKKLLGLNIGDFKIEEVIGLFGKVILLCRDGVYYP